MAGAMYRQVGFSLLELIAVLVVIGILAAVAAPRMDHGSGIREFGFAALVLSDLRIAQYRARADRCPVRVTVASSGFAIEQRTTLCSGAFNRDVARSGESGATLGGVPPEGMTLAATPAVFYFDPSGAAVGNVGGAAVDVVVAIGSRQIDVVGATGYAAF